MIEIRIPKTEYLNEEDNKIYELEEKTIRLEHSLLSISKWESIFEKPFFGKTEKTNMELLEYIKCMTLTQNVPDEYYTHLSDENREDISNYMVSHQSATRFTNEETGGSKEATTSEMIYYLMVAHQIPFEAQKWHINRLLNLIRIIDLKSGNSKGMSKSEILRRNKRLNEARKKKYNTRG